MADMLRYHLDAFLSAAPRVGIAAGASYRQVLAWKGAILERQRRLRDLRRLLRADPRPEVARAAAEWQSVVVRLATLALATPGPNQQDAWRRQLAELTERKDQLEEELTRQSAAFRAARAEARRTPEQLQAALPRDAALIDLLEYTHSSPPPERKGKTEVRASPGRVRGPARSADRAGGAGAAGADPGGDRRLAADPEARAAGAPGRARRPGGAAAAAGLEPLGRAPGGGGDGAGLARRGAGPGAAGGPAGQGGGFLPDRGLHDRPGPRAPDVRRRRGGRGGGPEAGDGAGRGAVAAAGRRRRLRRRPRRGVRPRSRAGRPPSAPAPGCCPTSRNCPPPATRSRRSGVISRLTSRRFPEPDAALLATQGDRGGVASGGLDASLSAPGHARLLRPARNSARRWGRATQRRGRGRTSSALGESPASIRGCSRAWRWPGPTSGPPRSARMTAS